MQFQNNFEIFKKQEDNEEANLNFKIKSNVNLAHTETLNSKSFLKK